MKKQTLFIFCVLIFLAIVTSPFWVWAIQPSKKLNVLILDKTVPESSYREHKGLMWILNNNKYVKSNRQPYNMTSDYKGFKPEKGNQYSIASLPKNLEPYDVFYLTDQYGVYQEDFYHQNKNGRTSEKIYGGLEWDEVNRLEKALLSSTGKTLIAEFNTFASPTSDKVKEKISNLLNIEWSGWTGRYFSDLSNSEVPEWVKKDYESHHGKWNYTGQGLVFISKNNFIVVIDQKDLNDNGVLFSLTKKGQKLFHGGLQGKYQYWFDINSANNTDEVLASYQLPVSKEAEKKLKEYGIPIHFPAVIFHQNVKYSSYYFAGDYADEQEVPQIYQTKGFDVWKKHFGAKDSFYWEVYVPMMKDVLKNGLHHKMDQESIELSQTNGITTNSKTGDNYIQIQRNGKWENFLVKGVNMGIGKPGYFPGEAAITKEEYFRWFKEIGAMNANAIRVYTLHPPQFYQAFYEYNQIAKKPLYLLHGTWVNEENLLKTQDAFNEENLHDAQAEIKNMIDIIHGQANLPVRQGHASGVYKDDISKYVLGFIIGTEWDPKMVENTNALHKDINQFTGKYFITKDANPFEIWLAGLMEFAVEYEAKTYKWQHSMSFTNWVTTDLLKHPAEPFESEDLVTIDPNHITANHDFYAGVFASYHIYPYYPEFLNHEKSYIDYVDQDGKKNNYAGYLHDLKAAHHMPVLVAEFGVPSSRGLTHKNVYGMNQGLHTEQEQGDIDQRLYKSIVAEEYAGGMVFSWQDEWFKRTWNTMDFDDPNRRPYWDNVQTSEQHFGLLSFDPGKKETGITVDGSPGDWDLAGVKKIYESKNKKDPLKSVQITSDSGYLYYLLTYNHPIDFKKEGTYFLFDTIGNQGQMDIQLTKKARIKTNFGIDFLVKLTGIKDSRILVDSYYDSYYYLYAHLLHMIKNESYASTKNNGVFHPIRLTLNKQLTIPSTNITYQFDAYETGILRFGNANPNDRNFDSLTDVSISKDQKVLEGRIPWQLLNVKDPSLNEVMGDVWKDGLTGSVKTEGIRMAVAVTGEEGIQQVFPKKSEDQVQEQDTALYKWDEWNEPFYHERLKKSYDILKKAFQTIDIKK